MNIIQEGRDLVVAGLGDFDPAQTLDCGQAFRWEDLGGGRFRGVACGREMDLAWDGQALTMADTAADEFTRLWVPYLDLGRDYSALKARFCADPVLGRAIAFAPGIRVLRQDGWEALCSFVISQNNNVPRIKGIISRLCQGFGAPLPGGGFDFPRPQALAGLEVEDLAPLRAGFRAKYILDAARRAADGSLELERLPTLPLEEAQARLCQILGVGPKVAQCALLYGFGRAECFPLDVWIKRVMAQLYPQGLPACVGREAGIAQQYLFHYARCSGALSA